MDILVVSGIALTTVLMCLTLKKHGQPYSMVLNVVACVLIIFMILSNMSPIITQVKNLISYAKIPSEYSSVLFKSLGICFVAQFCADVCEDAGEKGIAAKVELAAKIAVLISALPLFEKITQTAVSFMGAR